MIWRQTTGRDALYYTYIKIKQNRMLLVFAPKNGGRTGRLAVKQGAEAAGQWRAGVLFSERRREGKTHSAPY